MPSASTSSVMSRVAALACCTSVDAMSGFVVNTVMRSKYGDTTSPTTSVTATTSADTMHMITKSAFLGRFTGLACSSFSPVISPLSLSLACPAAPALQSPSDGHIVAKTLTMEGSLS